MKKLLNMTYQKGFTLIELMIVIAIIAILATIAIPTYQSYVKKAAITELIQASIPYKTEVEICIYNKSSANGCNASSNGIQANNLGDNSKYLDSIQVSNGIIEVHGKASLANISYTMTPAVSSTEDKNNIKWTISCSAQKDLFPADFCGE